MAIFSIKCISEKIGNTIPLPLPCSGGGFSRNWYYWLKIKIVVDDLGDMLLWLLIILYHLLVENLKM
ncbi:hypothetical protein BW716_15330 [[Flexibacter] sp. ATCC 35208]|nr:hypothetical protein BW716_15330 [[Flexibacter] sp. ATCC 35208]